jgi:hypothetical protein
MTKGFTRPTIGILLVLLLATPPAAAKVGVDFDETYDFTPLETYAWKPGQPAADELSQKRIVDGVNRELQERGYEPVTEGRPDFYVVTETSGEKQVKSSNRRVGLSVGKSTSFGGVRVGGSRGGGARQVVVGTLVIAILDGESEDLVWRANASETITNDPQKTAAMIEKAIEKAFKKFPPGKK